MRTFPSIAEINDTERITGRFWKVLIALYAPIGVFALVGKLISIFIVIAIALGWRQAAYSLRTWVVRLLGLRVTIRGNVDAREPHGPATIVAYNHVSLYDAYALSLLPNLAIATADDIKRRRWVNYSVERFFASCFNIDLRVLSGSRETFRMLLDWKNEPAGQRLAVAPEGTINNGKGLFRFQKTVFGLNVPVVPIAIVAVPAFPVSLYNIRGSSAANLVWPIFLPFVTYRLNALPTMLRESDETPQAFADRVQAALANELGIPRTQFTPVDKQEYRRSLGAMR